MKRSILLATTMMSVAVASTEAQNMVDAARYSQTDIIGTARYRSMAGAFGALGGDPTCMNDNPAGIGIYRGTNTFSITPHFTYNGTESKGAVKLKEDNNNFAVSDLSAIISFRLYNESVVNFNLGVGFTRRMENQNRMLAAMDSPYGTFGGYLAGQANHYLHGDPGHKRFPGIEFDWGNTNSYAPFLSMMAYDCYAIDNDPNDNTSVIDPNAGLSTYTQDLYMRETSRMDNYNISGAVNIGDMLYIGATMSISDFNSIVSSEFTEEYNDGDYYTYYDNRFETKGSGVGFNVGVLWNAVDNLRLGAALHTPTWYTMDSYCEGAMTTDQCEERNYWSDYNDTWRYDFYTPWEYQLSAAYIFGTKGLLSMEYDLRDFTTMKYRSANNNSDNAGYEIYNDRMDNFMALQHTFKAGAEYRLTDEISLRGGYAFITSPFEEKTLKGKIPTDQHNLVYYETTKPNSANLGSQYYTTCGLGWRGENWTIDCSYMYHHSKYHMIAYPGDFAKFDAVEVNMGKHDFDITFGYRF